MTMNWETEEDLMNVWKLHGLIYGKDSDEGSLANFRVIMNTKIKKRNLIVSIIELQGRQEMLSKILSTIGGGDEAENGLIEGSSKELMIYANNQCWLRRMRGLIEGRR